MANKAVTNIVLACENQDATSLLKSVDRALTTKLVENIDRMKQDVGGRIFKTVIKENAEWQDTYESYDPKIQEAIDYVVESILESGLELENTIKMASKQYNVSEESLTEYFDSVVEDVQVVSTSSDDHDEKGGVRDDEDTNKRVRYEQLDPVFELRDGTKIILAESDWNKVDQVLSNLSEDNQHTMVDMLKKDRSSFDKMIKFCQKMATD